MITIPITLDPAHPTLDHHRPGGLPLLGTAMGVGLMSATAENALPYGPVRRIEVVRIFAPRILRTAEPGSIEIAIVDETRDLDRPGCRAKLFSRASENEPETIHFECRMLFSQANTDHDRVDRLPPFGPFAITGADVYHTFFHGPSFQVVAAAELRGSRLVSQLSNAPALEALPATTRLVEFAMQSAGLLELALTGRMMVPHRIANFEIYFVEPVTEYIVAVVNQKLNTKKNSSEYTNILLIDGEGRKIASLIGYKTVPLPFEADQSKMGRLTDALRHSGGMYRVRTGS